MLVDIDGDGDLDAFVGDNSGNTNFFRNTGTAIGPVFAANSPNPFALTDVGKYASPAFADLDGDGDLDALIGDGNDSGPSHTVFFENTGTATGPAFAPGSVNAFGLVDTDSLWCSNGRVRHARFGGRSMPVLDPRRCPDHVALPDALNGLSPLLDQPGAGGDEKQLSFAMAVPGRTRAGREGDRSARQA